MIDATKTLAKLDPSNDEDLTEEELVWLRDQDRLPRHLRESMSHIPVTFGVEGSLDRVSNDPNALAQTQLQGSGLFQSMVEERAKEMAAQLLREQQQGTLNVLGGETTGRVGNAPVEVTHGSNPKPDNSALASGDGEEEDGVPPYDQWPNQDLRAELLNRGLDPSGKKTDLVSRLEESDREESSKSSNSGDEKDGGSSDEGDQGGS